MSKKEDWTKRRKAKQIAVGRSSKPTTRPMVVVVEHPKRERERDRKLQLVNVRLNH